MAPRFLSPYYLANAACIASYALLRRSAQFDGTGGGVQRLASAAELRTWVSRSRPAASAYCGGGRARPAPAQPRHHAASMPHASSSGAVPSPTSPKHTPTHQLPRPRRAAPRCAALPQELQCSVAFTAVAIYKVWRRRSPDGAAAQLLFYAKVRAHTRAAPAARPPPLALPREHVQSLANARGGRSARPTLLPDPPLPLVMLQLPASLPALHPPTVL